MEKTADRVRATRRSEIVRRLEQSGIPVEEFPNPVKTVENNLSIGSGFKHILFFIAGVFAVLLSAAFRPPDLLVWINLFAFGGLEAVFLWPIVLGLYWKKANAAGTLCSIAAGLGAFMFLSVAKISVFGLHPIVPTLLLSFAAFHLGVRLGAPVPEEVTRLFWED